MRVLVVEDNVAFAAIVAEHLQRAGFESDRTESVGQAKQAVSSMSYAAIILDLGLRDGDGMEFLRDLRTRGDATPILITSARHGLEDRVLGLRAGADDYLAKPFSIDELIARLRAVLRRPGKLLGEVMKAGNVTLDTRSRQVNIADRIYPMRVRTTTVLELLMRHLGSVVPRRYFEDQLFGIGDGPDSNAVEVYVHRLRRQLEAAGAAVTVHTIRGVGYMLTETKQTSDHASGCGGGNVRAGRQC